MSSDIDVSQYLNVFLEETKEHLQTLTQALIDLEGSDAESAAEALNEAFRAVHTIKGMSASMEFRNMEHLCHSVEDVLDELRSGSRGVTPEIIDLLLESSTKLEELTGSIEENGNDDIDVSAVLSELKNLLSGEKGKEKEKEKEKEKKEEEEEGNEERGSVQKRKTYEIKVSLDKSCEFKGARGFLALKNLAEIGEVLKTIPSQDDIENGNFDSEFEILLATDADEEGVKNALMSVGDIEKVDIFSGEGEEKEEVAGVKSRAGRSKDNSRKAFV